MPCRDGSWDAPSEPRRHGMTIADFEATLCAVFTAVEANSMTHSTNFFLDTVDWKECGVKRKTVEMWWRKHKEEDEARRIREESARRKEELRAAALSKLTPEEKAALGIK